MYHERYTRRRAADSFCHQDAEKSERNSDEWSWSLFVSVLLVQVTSRSIWASLGVISAFLLADYGSSWVLLSTPITFSVAWGLTEPWIKRLCKQIHTTREFMYVVTAGTILSWFGTIIAVKSPIRICFLVPLIGIVGGCGANTTATASIALVRKHYPTRNGAVRFFEQITASSAFFLMPVLSHFIMDAFGDHGGLLIHSGVIMQGLVGAVLLRSAKWQIPSRPRAYTFIDYGSDDLSLKGPQADDDIKPNTHSFQFDEKFEPRKKSNKSYGNKRQAFGLGGSSFTPPQKRKRRMTLKIALPSIYESTEEDVENNEDESPDTQDAMTPDGNQYPILGSTNFVNHEDCESCVCNNRKVISERSPHGPVEEISRENNPLLHCNSQTVEERTSQIIINPFYGDIRLKSDFSPNLIRKPARTFVHVFPSGRHIEEERNRNSFDESSINSSTFINFTEKSNDSKQSDSSTYKSLFASTTSIKGKLSSAHLRRNVADGINHISNVFQTCLTNWNDTITLIMNPLTVPAAFLLFATQNSLLTFISLTPVLLTTYVEDGTWMDGAFCISIMGFTWLCFVLSSPCFSTIHFTNHQAICVVALVCSSLTLYLVSESQSVDEVVLYSSLFGLSYGVARMTSHSILKMSFGRQLQDLSVLLSVVASLFQLTTLMIVGLFDWCNDSKNLYKVPVLALLLAAIFWVVQGCVSSVRANRGQHEFTWSRRRRFS